MEYYNELPDGRLGIIRSKTTRVWHTDKKTAVSSSSQRDSGLTAVFCMPNVLVFFRKGDVRCCFREISCIQHQDRLNTFVSREEQKPLPQPTSEKPVACHACNDDDCSKNRKCDEENTGNHLASLSHSQRLLLERFSIVLMMPMVVMVDVFVIVMSDGSFSIYVH